MATTLKNETFEYAIKKDVRNNPIVREVDERRLREQWHTLVIVVLLVRPAGLFASRGSDERM